MKTAVIIVIVTFSLVDTFLMWCLLRASALYEQNENRTYQEKDASDRGKETPNEKKEENL